MEFDPQKHICKFFYYMEYEYDNPNWIEYRQRISADLYLQELKIEIVAPWNKVVAVYGYSLEDQMQALLPLIEWEKFEKTRDVSGYNLCHNGGYRDCWHYNFLCLNESGKPPIRNQLDVLFSGKHKPAYEKLLAWIIPQYKNKKEFKKYHLVW